jgi:recombination protein RecT
MDFMTTPTPQTTQVSVIDTVYQALDHMQPKFKAALPTHIDPKKFTRVAITAIQNTPDLQDIAKQSPAARQSIYNACSRAAADGLMPDGREGAIVAFNRKIGENKYEKHAQWMPMVEGLRKMVRNSGEITNLSVQVVHENDHFDYQLGDQEFIVHKPALTARGKIIGAYSIATLKDGEKSREFMDIDQINAIKERSKTSKFGPWVSDFSEMARKTVFRRHYKSLPKSTDLDKVIEHDDDMSDLPQHSPQHAASHTGPDFTIDATPHGAHQDATQPVPKPRQSRAKAAMKQAEPAQTIEHEVEFDNQGLDASGNITDEQETDIV